MNKNPSPAPASRLKRRAVLPFLLLSFTAAATLTAISVTAGMWLLSGGKPDPQFMMTALAVDAGLLFALLCFFVRHIRRQIKKSRLKGGEAGAHEGTMRLQTRIAIVFSLVAAIPAIAMALFSTLLFDAGIRSWFDNKVSNAIQNSVAVAEAYLEEHKNVIAADILGVANDLNRGAYMIMRNPGTLDQKLTLLAGVRKLPEALIFTKDGALTNIVARSNLTIALEFYMDAISDEAIERADEGEAVVITMENEDRVTAVMRLQSFNDAYLFVGRPIDRDILNYVDKTRGAAKEYMRMERGISALHMQFLIIFLFMAAGLLTAVIAYSVYFAANIVRPVKELARGAEAIAEGDYGVRVNPKVTYPELRSLTDTFNRMSGTLEEQKRELISAQRHRAWSEIARRIAHEIKNPLTPIQLSAERLQKKIGKLPDEAKDPAFARYLDTIARNVTQIRNIIEEFTVFAKIKPPVMEERDCVPVIRETMTSQEIASSGVLFTLHTHDADGYVISCDAGKLSQIILNIMKNAAEALEEYYGEGSDAGRVETHVFAADGVCAVVIADNGPGFPENLLPSLTEPYVTTKKKGTGLGLAIVKKLVEDHGGDITFANRNTGGAETTLVFPLVKVVKRHS